MNSPICRACWGAKGDVVLDLGLQPPSDYFPRLDDRTPDPAYPLQMWLCATCGLAQLLLDPTVPEEPKATEPLALVEQAHDAVERITAAGWLRPGKRVIEYGSPHGGSWLPLLAERGLLRSAPNSPADVVLDCFGLMHCADQLAAVTERVDRLKPGGVLFVQYHSLATIIERGQWNSLRHGHYAYYSATALSDLLGAVGLVLRAAWTFDLYGGTVLLAATRASEHTVADWPNETVRAILAAEQRLGVRDPAVLRRLQTAAVASAVDLRTWLVARRRAGARVIGYGAASRSVALLCRAHIGRDLLPAIADASIAKQGSRMPATDIPVIAPEQLASEKPDDVLLLLPDLLGEVREMLPEIEAAGARWVDVDTISRASK